MRILDKQFWGTHDKAAAGGLKVASTKKEQALDSSTAEVTSYKEVSNGSRRRSQALDNSTWTILPLSRPNGFIPDGFFLCF